MDLKLFLLISLSVFMCFINFGQCKTFKSTISGLQSLPETNSSIIYELSSTPTEIEPSINKQFNNTRNGQEILNGQEQRQNQFTQGRGSPNKFPPQFQGNNYNYGLQPDNYQRQQGLSRSRQQNNQLRPNQPGSSQQLTNPYDILNSIIPPSGQNGFRTRTPQKQQQSSNQSDNGYPIGGNYPGSNHGFNPNQVQDNVGDNRGLGYNNPSEGYNDQPDGTESPESADQNDDGNEEINGHSEEGNGDEGVEEGAERDDNQEVTPNEENHSGDKSNEADMAERSGEGGEGGEGGEDGEGGEGDAVTPNNDNGDTEETANSNEVSNADEPNGQEGGEQDPSNDPDLAQFQNFQGGNFPGDLFPPGILNQQDLNEIQKSIEEQQRKEAEKQKAEEEAGTQNGGEEEGGEGEDAGGADEGTEGGEGGETDQPAAAPPLRNQYIPGVNRPINNQAHLLAMNRALAARNRNPGLIGIPFNRLTGPRDSSNANRFDGGGYSDRGDFGTGIQDYEYERPKVNQEEDEIPKRLRDNPPLFGRNRFFPTSIRGGPRDEEEDRESDDEERIPPPHLRNRFSGRFDRFRPRLFGRPGRYNNDLGDYGIHRANSNQHPSLQANTLNQFNPTGNSNRENQMRQSIAQNSDQSILNYETKSND